MDLSYSTSSSSDDAYGEEPLHRVELVLSPLLKLPGVKAFHSSVVIDGVEIWFNPEGLCYGRVPGILSHSSTIGEPVRLVLGDTDRSIKDLLDNLGPYFRSGTYDMIKKNCNAFSDCAVYFLLRRRVMAQYLVLDHLAALVPETASKLIGSRYKKNPRAEDFDIESVIAGLGPESEEGQPSKNTAAPLMGLLSGCRASPSSPESPTKLGLPTHSSSSTSTCAGLDSSACSDSVDDDCVIVSDDEEDDLHTCDPDGRWNHAQTGFSACVSSPLRQCALVKAPAHVRRDWAPSLGMGRSNGKQLEERLGQTMAMADAEGSDLLLAL